MPLRVAAACPGLLQVMGFSSRREADDFIHSRRQFVLGAVHFSETPGKQLQYILQSNTSVRVCLLQPGQQQWMQQQPSCAGTLQNAPPPACARPQAALCAPCHPRRPAAC